MHTDASGVLQHGIALGHRTFRRFLTALEWPVNGIDKTVCHQVGTGHRQLMLDRLELSLERDYATVTHLGNMGTVSLPLSAAMAEEDGFFVTGDRVGFLGIGSGLNCMMLGLHW
jgi:3-oxoacyl-[acyl-carrier-protein] synthase-3